MNNYENKQLLIIDKFRYFSFQVMLSDKAILSSLGQYRR